MVDDRVQPRCTLRMVDPHFVGMDVGVDDVGGEGHLSADANCYGGGLSTSRSGIEGLQVCARTLA